jgi:hypothetical protein
MLGQLPADLLNRAQEPGVCSRRVPRVPTGRSSSASAAQTGLAPERLRGLSAPAQGVAQQRSALPKVGLPSRESPTRHGQKVVHARPDRGRPPQAQPHRRGRARPAWRAARPAAVPKPAARATGPCAASPSAGRSGAGPSRAPPGSAGSSPSSWSPTANRSSTSRPSSPPGCGSCPPATAANTTPVTRSRSPWPPRAASACTRSTSRTRPRCCGCCRTGAMTWSPRVPRP